MASQHGSTTIRLLDWQIESTIVEGTLGDNHKIIGQHDHPREYRSLGSRVTDHSGFEANLASSLIELLNADPDAADGHNPPASVVTSQHAPPRPVSFLDCSATFDFTSMAREPTRWTKITRTTGLYTDVYAAASINAQGRLTYTIDVVVLERARNIRRLPPNVAVTLLSVPSTTLARCGAHLLKDYLDSMFDLNGELSEYIGIWGNRSNGRKLPLFQTIKACVKCACDQLRADSGP